VARRAVAADPAAGLAAIVSSLQTTEDPVSVDFLKGAHEALRGFQENVIARAIASLDFNVH
jgi:hypothetical protein